MRDMRYALAMRFFEPPPSAFWEGDTNTNSNQQPTEDSQNSEQ
jgi:hypothetical protein